jgi:enamine deaminase RidA (YjgF/YER057c/UK114 family)
MKIEEKIEGLGLKLPEAPEPVANYVQAVRVGDLVFSAGQGPIVDGAPKYVGKVGEDLTMEEGYEAAKIAALNCLSAIKTVIDDLDKIDRIVKVSGFVNSAPGFTDQSKVMNGASDLLVKIFGDKGRHARGAIGSNELPLNNGVEIELIVKVKQ